MTRAYAVYDVFTETPLKGNPLAVVFDAEGLSDEAMQAITREFNLSETVFVLAPTNPAHTAKLRIFTPGKELPFAGHPTVGAAIALAERLPTSAARDVMSMFEEGVGPIRCAIKLSPGYASFAEFDLPKVSVQSPAALDAEQISDALCVSAADIGFENHQPSVWSAGVPFVMTPLRDIAAVRSVRFDPARWVAAVGDIAAYVYCRGGEDHRASFHARMFAPDMGIAEDPATGGAAAAMSGAIQMFDGLTDGHHALLIEQGVEMGRASLINLHIESAAGQIARARIGGHAVRISEGMLHL